MCFAQCLGKLCVSCLRSASSSMWKKVCLGVLHIELVIMYKLFLPLLVYDFVIKFFVHAVVGWSLFTCLHLLCSVVNGPCVVRASCCCNVCCCSVTSCVLRSHVGVCWVLVLCQNFLQMLMLLILCVDQLITNNFIFFFFIILRSSTSSSCSYHVMSCHVVLTSLPCVTKFLSYIFFFHTLVWLLLSSCRYFKCSLILIIITSYLSSYIVSSKFFFFLLLSSLLLQCVATHTRGAVRLLRLRVLIH
jgi:hypothetical protein